MRNPSGKRILVAGVTGLVGEALAVHLAGNNEVHGLARLTDSGAAERLRRAGVTLWQKDVAADSLDDLPDDMDLVLNQMACWEGDTPEGCRLAYEINAFAAGRLMLRYPEARHVYGSTGAIYRVVYGETYSKEDELPGPHPGSVYALTKTMGESVVTFVSREYRIPACILRYYYMWGPQPPAIAVGPQWQVIYCLEQGEEIPVNTKEPNLFQPTYITDVVDLTLASLDHCAYPPAVFNIAGAETVNIIQVAEIAGRLMGKEPNYRHVDGTGHYLGDISRMRSMLGEPRVSLEEGMRQALAARQGVQTARCQNRGSAE